MEVTDQQARTTDSLAIGDSANPESAGAKDNIINIGRRYGGVVRWPGPRGRFAGRPNCVLLYCIVLYCIVLFRCVSGATVR